MNLSGWHSDGRRTLVLQQHYSTAQVASGMNTGDMLLLLLDRYNREIKISNARAAGLAQSNATKPAPGRGYIRRPAI
ncbi:MAG: hypothetical protein J0H29_11465 [Sphingobacteriales bacterium]|nr:hypothetical protein [Sphingobacteriales bacterium]